MLVRVDELMLSPLVFDLELERAKRLQHVQTSEREFRMRADPADGAASEIVFQKVIESVEKAFSNNGLDDVVHKTAK